MDINLNSGCWSPSTFGAGSSAIADHDPAIQDAHPEWFESTNKYNWRHITISIPLDWLKSLPDQIPAPELSQTQWIGETAVPACTCVFVSLHANKGYKNVYWTAAWLYSWGNTAEASVRAISTRILANNQHSNLQRCRWITDVV